MARKKAFGSFQRALCLLLFCALLPSLSHGAATADYLDDLLAAARAGELDSQRYWEVLLHYKKRGRGVESLIDDPRFFLSPEGKRSPGAELAATLRAFYSTDSDGDDHPLCRFPARYAWLEKELAIDAETLPEVRCPELEESLAAVKPHSAALIFPAAYMNSPASMFGHTLIRIDAEGGNPLLAYAVNYSAKADDTNGLLYAAKGLLGFYKGFFSVMPYYERVKEYSDMKFRDMWEYDLDLTVEEVNRMLLHIWELRDIFSYYYFFDENCSFNLLFLLEAARPDVNLTDGFGLSVMPVDTIRAVRKAGFIEDVEYRPSKATKIQRMATRLSPDEQTLVLEIATGKKGPESASGGEGDESAVRVLDTAAEYIQSRFAKSGLGETEYRKLFLATLRARGALAMAGHLWYEVPRPDAPLSGHKSGRFAVGLGQRRDDAFYELKYRPAYHDLMDGDAGYTRGAQVDFLSFTVRGPLESESPRVTSFSLVDIRSVTPRDRFFKTVSWKVRTGIMEKAFSREDDHRLFYLNPGGGFAFEGKLPGIVYCFFETELNIGGSLEESYAFGAGAEVGMVRSIGKTWKLGLTARGVRFVLGHEHTAAEASAALRYIPHRNHSLGLTAKREKAFGLHTNEAAFSWNIYW